MCSEDLLDPNDDYQCPDAIREYKLGKLVYKPSNHSISGRVIPFRELLERIDAMEKRLDKRIDEIEGRDD